MSSSHFVAHNLKPDQVEAWDKLASAYGTVFDSTRWTNLFEPRPQRVGIYDQGGFLRGGFSIWEQKRFGFRVLRNPPYTPCIGPFYEPRTLNSAARTDEQRGIVEAMASYLSSSGAALVFIGLSASINDCLPFRWRGWKVVPHYTYRIDLTQSEDEIMASFSSQRRKSIRRAREEPILIEEVEDLAEVRSLALESFARQGKRVSHVHLNSVLTGYAAGGQSFCYVARREGRAEAAAFVVHDSRTAYYLVGGYSEGAHHGAGPLTMWHAILRARDLGLTVFDFEGSIVPPIERYFRGFGGTLTPLLSAQRAWPPIEVFLKHRLGSLFQ